MALVDRVKSILLNPKPTWAAIEAEPATPAGLYKDYLLWLAVIPAVCGFIGMSLIGVGASASRCGCRCCWGWPIWWCPTC